MKYGEFNGGGLDPEVGSRTSNFSVSVQEARQKWNEISIDVDFLQRSLLTSPYNCARVPQRYLDLQDKMIFNCSVDTTVLDKLVFTFTLISYFFSALKAKLLFQKLAQKLRFVLTNKTLCSAGFSQSATQSLVPCGPNLVSLH